MDDKLVKYLKELEYRTLIFFASTFDMHPASGIYSTSFLARYIVDHMTEEEVKLWYKVFKLDSD